ncbi:lysozyme inhibitor LprI family protein [Sphingomonas sp.]|uniref:lysozyme inhibitor LprI family protein n=1 Tax=Sphingomonas sp. TaxID=28214 RepID=UPI003AFF8D8C
MRRLLLVAALPLMLAMGPGSPSGEYVVVSAARNPAVSNAAARYRADDPRLVGRIVSFAGPRLSFDGDYTLCKRATTTTQRTTAGRIVRQVMPRGAGGRGATPADAGLRLAASAPVTVTRFRCIVAGTHGADWDRAVLFPIDGGRWAFSIAPDHLMILQPAAGAIRGSFACARARSPVERTICGDRVLAGWDRSVAAAYAGGDLAEQRTWLAERDRCGADRDCLHESMSLRVENLLH